MREPKFCKDCKWCHPNPDYRGSDEMSMKWAVCGRTASVDPKLDGEKCWEVRWSWLRCGKRARWFEAKA